MKTVANICIIILAVQLMSCSTESNNKIPSSINEEEKAVQQLLEAYVNGWKEMNEEKVMSLLEDNAMIQPNRLAPITGKENIRDFWFPKDNSITTINQFDTEILSLILRDTIAIMTYESLLDWNYKKDTVSFGMIQKGINTTVYRRQKDKKWKMWRSMWTDVFAKPK